MTERQRSGLMIRGFFRLLEVTVVGCLGLMVVLVFGNVVLRYGFNSGIEVSEELSRIVFVWVIFLGAIIGFRERAHLGVDTIIRHLPRAGKLACYVVSDALMLAICILVFHGSLIQARINLQNPAPVTGIPLAVGYAMSMFMTAAIAVMIVHSLYRALTGSLTDDELSQVRESEESADLQEVERRAAQEARTRKST